MRSFFAQLGYRRNLAVAGRAVKTKEAGNQPSGKSV
jgi:hypothetical protein